LHEPESGLAEFLAPTLAGAGAPRHGRGVRFFRQESERLDRLGDAASPGVGAFRVLEPLHVLALVAVRQRVERRVPTGGVERGG